MAYDKKAEIIRITIPFILTAERLCDLLCTFFEGGNLWAIPKETAKPTKKPEYWYEGILDGAEWDIFDAEDDSKIGHLSLDIVRENFHLVAEKYPELARNICDAENGDYDANDADLAMQFIVLKSHVYC